MKPAGRPPVADSLKRLEKLLRRPRSMAFLVEHFAVDERTINRWLQKTARVARKPGMKAVFYLYGGGP